MKKTILIECAHPIITNLIIDFLGNEDYRFFVCEDLHSSESFLHRNNADLVITDDSLREDDLSCLFLSVPKMEDRHDVLAKPFNPDELCDLVTKLLEEENWPNEIYVN